MINTNEHSGKGLSRDREDKKNMRVAIPRYNGRISPRFGFTQDILIVDLVGTDIRSQEILPMDRHLPHEIPNMLSGKGVEVVLTGGMNLQFQNLFRAHGIKVLWGLIGTPEEALDAYLAGDITPGMGLCPFRGRGQRHRRGRFWG